MDPDPQMTDSSPAPDPETLEQLRAENAELRQRLEENDETIRAIRRGEVDAFVVQLDQGERIYSLRGAEHAYAAFVQHMREGALTVHEDGTILYANRRMVDMLGAPSQQIVGTRLLDHVAPEDGYVAEALLQRGRGRETAGEVSFLGRRGNRVPAHLTIFPVDLDGLLATCVLVSDLTEINRYRYDVDRLVETRVAELTAEKDELRQASDAKNLLVARLGGEIARRAAELEQAQGSLRAAKPDDGSLGRAMVKLRALVEDVYSIGDIESGSARLSMSSLQLRDVAADSIETVTPAARERNVDVVLDVPPKQVVRFMTDETKLRRLLDSLLLSAVEHTRDSSVRVTVGVTEELLASIEVRQPGEPAAQDDLDALLAGRFETELLDRVTPFVDPLSLWAAGRMARFLGGVLEARVEERATVFRFSMAV
jgi:PAS domain S-box-containing protein